MKFLRGRQLPILMLMLVGCAQAWISHHPTKTLSSRMGTKAIQNKLSSTSLQKGPMDFLSPYESKIPDELKDEIYQAEGNTAAAQERGQRVGLYALIAFCGILCAFFNGFLTELRTSGGPDGGGVSVDLYEAGFGWVLDNFLFSFLFLNKIGGGICLLGGAGAGLLAEAEFDTKRINAEKIYDEMVRRRDSKTKKKKKKVGGPSSSKKKRRSGKEAKRLEALSEVIQLEDKSASVPETKEPEAAKEEAPVVEAKEEKKGVFGGIKDFYDKADSMAASSALLLNKQLEDAGVVDKITDESGLKVIGRDEAAKLKENKLEEKKEGETK